MKKILFALTLLLSLGSTLWIEQATAKTVSVTIRNSSDWDAFREEVKKAKGQYWVDATLEADISTVYGIGLTSDAPYRGTFNGNGHTLNVDIKHGAYPGALFCYASDVTIRDLHLTGKISGDRHSGGLIGCVTGSPAVTIARVWVSTEVTTSSTHAGGIIGHSDFANVHMTDCLFDGRVVTNNTNDSFAGEIIGWRNGGNWTLDRVYDNGSPVAHWMFYCIEWRPNDGQWYAWGSDPSSYTISRHGWDNVDQYNKSGQNEVVNLMNNMGPGTWELVNGKAVPVMDTGDDGSWKVITEGSNSGYVLMSGHYYIPKDLTFSNSNAGRDGITIAAGSTVHFYIPKGVTLTARGANASGRTGAGAGIYLPQSSTLVLEGGGTVNATGGNAANGGDGQNGVDAQGNFDTWSMTGAGGTGGYGGGGAGAGIGTRGGAGGAGGAGGGCSSGMDYGKNIYDGTNGSDGRNGETAADMGSLYVDNTGGITVSAKGGAESTSNGSRGDCGKSIIEHFWSYANYSVCAGGGGGGGGAGGSAQSVGTGGPGGGGGGGGAGGAKDKRQSKYVTTYAGGGKGGKDGNGEAAADGQTAACDPNYINASLCNTGGYKWDFDDWRGDRQKKMGNAGNGGSQGKKSQRSNYNAYEYRLHFKVIGADSKTATITYKSNSSGNVNVTIPAPYALGLTQTDKYVSAWYRNSNVSGSQIKIFDAVNIHTNDNYIYGVWKPYKDIFPEGYGTKSSPFIIKEGLLLELADYVNSGANTRNVYFKQSGDIRVSDVLNKNNRGSNWVPIGNSLFHVFEGDYDGGGFLIRDIAINTFNDVNPLGIFGRVTGSIHNLGVENSSIVLGNNDARCGTIAGMLLDNRDGLAGKIANCYVAKSRIAADYGGVFVGEMEANTSISYCHEFDNRLNGGHAASFSSIINSNAKVDKCFTGGTSFSADGYDKATNSSTRVSSTQMASGEITWLLNDKSTHGVTWYQDVDRQGYRDDYPVLDNTSSAVYYYDNKYSNNKLGPLTKLSGKGTREEPFLITGKADLELVASFCNGGLRSNGIYFLQTADIDLNGANWKPVGSRNSYAFEGHYDGGGHTIRNGKIELKAPDLAGIFGVVKGTVTHLCVEKTTVTSVQNGDDHAQAGGIAARINGNGEISHCFVKECTIACNGTGVAGGIVSDVFDQGTIRNSLVVNSKITGSRTGSICSDMHGSIIRCFTDGDVLISSASRGSSDEKSLPALGEATLQSGQICFELNGGGDNPDPIWFQNIDQASDRDKTPVLLNSHAMVFNKGGKYTNDGQDLSKLGKGTKEDPYKIATPADFKALMYGIAQMKRSNFYVLQTADIDLRDSTIAPLGTTTAGFEGHYDGGGHVIRNVKMYHYEGESLGLFNNILGTVERLGIENGTFQAVGTINRVGAFAGRMSGSAQLRNCYVKNSTIDFNNKTGVVAGALVGEQTGKSRIESCYGYKNTVKGQEDGLKHYGYIVGYIDSDAKDSLVFTDGPSLCADKQSGLMNIVRSDTGIPDNTFNSGELCWVLAGAKDASDIWRQTIRTDNSPVLYKQPDKQTSNSLPVYAHTTGIKQTLYSNLTDEPATVAVTLDPNRDQEAANTLQVLKADDRFYVPALKLDAHIPNLQNVELVGWNTQADNKGTFYARDKEIVPSENMTLYAVWNLKIPAETMDESTVRVEKLTRDNTPIKIFDNGGSIGDYGHGYNGKLTLKAPEDYVICLLGTVTTEAPDQDNNPRDYLIVTDGDATSENRLTNEHAKNTDTKKGIYCSSTDGATEDIGVLLGTQEEMTLQFITDNQNSFKGLELTAKLQSKNLQKLGKGTKEEPFRVQRVTDLYAVDDYIRGTGNSNIYILQTATIDAGNEDFTPLASSVESFEGHYDGGGYVIKNMKVTDNNGAAVGLFRNVSGTVERLGIVNSTVKGNAAGARVGAIAGRLSKGGQVRNCYATDNSITAGTGGLAGAMVGELADTSRIESSYAYSNEVNGAQHGAVAGRSSDSAKQNLVFYDQPNTESSFRSGEICYQLNGSKSDNTVWRQTIGTDNLPVLDSSHGVVYYHRVVSNNSLQIVYTNTKELTGTVNITLHQNDGTGKKHTFFAYRQQSEAESDRTFNLEFAKFAYEGSSKDLKGSQPVFWTEKADGEGTRYSRRDMIKPDKDIELYAQWGKEIYTKEDFFTIHNKEGYFCLMQDVDLGNWDFHIYRLLGKLDGGGHTIKYHASDRCLGLFSYVSNNSYIKHLRVEANVVTRFDIGGIAYQNMGTISDCHFRGNITITQPILKNKIAPISLNGDKGSKVDHCSVYGTFTFKSRSNYSKYPFCGGSGTIDHCIDVDPTGPINPAHTIEAMNAQAEYPVFAKGVLDAARPSLLLGDEVIDASDKHLESLTIQDGQRFQCPLEVKVDNITYIRRGTKGAFEPWVLPFDYTIDERMMMGGAVEFYRFEKDSTGSNNITTVLISKDKPYQVAANEPLAFRSADSFEIYFEMKLVKDGKMQPMTVMTPIGSGVGASIKSTKDEAKIVVTYNTIGRDRLKKEMAYVWDSSKGDFVLSTGDKSLQPFRYYLQFTDMRGNPEQYERTDWARHQKKRNEASQGGAQQAPRRASLSELQAEGWKPIYLSTNKEQVITQEMLDDYEMLALYDVYDAEASDAENEGRYAVTVFYEPLEVGTTLEPALPLLVRAKHADAEPLVTEEMGRLIDSVLREIDEAVEAGDIDRIENYEEVLGPHYGCATFTGRYDIWQMPMPEDDNILNELGALTFADGGDKQYFHRVAASDGYSMQPMSYCFTAYDPRTYENLPLVNDRIEVVLPAGTGEGTGIETVQDSRFKVQDSEATYNLNGQRVNSSYRGIVIQNGRKVLRK